MRNPIIPIHLIDHKGEIWASGEFTQPKINQILKSYKAIGITLSMRKGLSL